MSGRRLQATGGEDEGRCFEFLFVLTSSSSFPAGSNQALHCTGLCRRRSTAQVVVEDSQSVPSDPEGIRGVFELKTRGGAVTVPAPDKAAARSISGCQSPSPLLLRDWQLGFQVRSPG